jgi:hypothetical protein
MEAMVGLVPAMVVKAAKDLAVGTELVGLVPALVAMEEVRVLSQKCFSSQSGNDPLSQRDPPAPMLTSKNRSSTPWNLFPPHHYGAQSTEPNHCNQNSHHHLRCRGY